MMEIIGWLLVTVMAIGGSFATVVVGSLNQGFGGKVGVEPLIGVVVSGVLWYLSWSYFPFEITMRSVG